MQTDGFGAQPTEQHLNLNPDSWGELWSRIGVEQECSLLVTGYSMRPFLYHNRSVVFIKKTARYNPRRGDIVLFCRKNGTVVLHRVLRVFKDGVLLINGDAQGWTETIDTEDVRAVVTRIRRKKRVFSVRSPLYSLSAAVWMRLRRWRPLLFLVARRLHTAPRGAIKE